MQTEIQNKLYLQARWKAAGSAGRLLAQTQTIEQAASILHKQGFIQKTDITAVCTNSLVVKLISTRHATRAVTGGVVFACVTTWLTLTVSNQGASWYCSDYSCEVDDATVDNMAQRLEEVRVSQIKEAIAKSKQEYVKPELYIIDTPLVAELVAATQSISTGHLVAVLDQEPEREASALQYYGIVEAQALPNTGSNWETTFCSGEVAKAVELIGKERLWQGILGQNCRSVAERWAFADAPELGMLEFRLQPIDLHHPHSFIQVSSPLDQKWDRQTVNQSAFRLSQVLKQEAPGGRLVDLVRVDLQVLDEVLESFAYYIATEQGELEDAWLSGTEV